MREEKRIDNKEISCKEISPKETLEEERELIKAKIRDSIAIKSKLLEDEELLSNIEKLAIALTAAIGKGGKLLICGNGGSACDALHIAAELVGRFRRERRAFPAIALNADVASMTAIANDYGYETIFARQVEAYASPGDLFLGISTSGNSGNVRLAAAAAKDHGLQTAALLGDKGGRLASQVDYPVIVPGSVTARIQECHILIGHILCEMAEAKLADGGGKLQ